MKFAVTWIAAGICLAALAAASARAESPPAATGTREVPANLFAISYRAGPNWKDGVPMGEQGLRDHFFYVKALDDAGQIALAGPVGGDAGLILLYARDQAEADRLMADDPAVKSGLFVGVARPFIARFGGVAPFVPRKP